MQAVISKTLLSKLKPDAKPFEVRDSRLPGFILRVQPSGSMSYYAEFARGRRMAIGKASVIKPDKARDRAKELLSGFALGNDPMEAKRAGKQFTLKTYIAEVYRPYAESHMKGPMKILHQISRCYPDLGDTKLADVSPFIFEKHRTKRLKDGLTGATTNRTLASLKASLNKAVEWGILKKNPLQSVKKQREDNNAVIRYLSPEENKRLREALEKREARRRQERERFNVWRRDRGYKEWPQFANFTDHLKPMVLLALNTGMRRGELFDLKWADVNFVGRSLTVSGITAKSGKTRHIPLNNEAIDVLSGWYAQRKDSELVFPSNDGGRMDNISTSWAKLMKDAKIENFRFHDLRHDFASQLVMAGVDLNTVRELLGHSDIKMTLRYAHLAPEIKAAAVAKLGGVR